MPLIRPTPCPLSAVPHGRRLRPRRAGRARWPAFVAALWSARRPRRNWQPVRRAAAGALVGSMLLVVPGCSELAQPSEAMRPAEPPLYGTIVAKYLQSVLKDQNAYDGYEISPLRWVHSIRGWVWLACVHFRDHEHLRSYAVFIQDGTVVDARFAVETDACDAQTYSPFDLLNGALGRPTPATQPPLY